MSTSEQITVNSLQANSFGGLSEIERVTKRTRRHYVVRGKELPSVTTVLKVWPKPALYNWYAKRGREAMAEYLSDYLGEPISPGLLEDAVAAAKIAPRRDAQEAADLGTMAHSIISMELAGQEVTVPPELDSVMRSFHDWQRDEHLTLVDSETAVYADRYAGTIDALFKRDNGAFLLVDFKTSKKIYSPEYDVQVFGYVDAISASLAGSVHIDGQIIRLGKEEPEFEVLEINNRKDRLGRLWRSALAFHAALEEAR